MWSVTGLTLMTDVATALFWDAFWAPFSYLMAAGAPAKHGGEE